MVPPASHGIPRVPRYSGFGLLGLPFTYGTLTLFGVPSHALLLDFPIRLTVRNPDRISTVGLASSAFARHYLRNLG